MKSLPFYIPEAWKRYPFRAEPPRIGHYREYPRRGLCLVLMPVLISQVRTRLYLAVLSFGRLFPWLDLPSCRNWTKNKPTTTAFHMKRSWKTFGLREMDSTRATNFPLGVKFARWVCMNLKHLSRSLFIVGLKWAKIPAFISDLLLHPCTTQRSGMIRFE